MLRSKTNFSEQVKLIVKNIRPGETMSYRNVATAAGNPKAARAVAMIMKSNYDPDIPCHRVVRSNGEVGGYNRGGSEVKANLLEIERARHMK